MVCPSRQSKSLLVLSLFTTAIVAAVITGVHIVRSSTSGLLVIERTIITPCGHGH